MRNAIIMAAMILLISCSKDPMNKTEIDIFNFSKNNYTVVAGDMLIIGANFDFVGKIIIYNGEEYTYEIIGENHYKVTLSGCNEFEFKRRIGSSIALIEDCNGKIAELKLNNIYI